MDALTAQPRTIRGKSVKTLRTEGLLPAVAYGKGVASEHISVSYNEFVKIWKSAGESSLILLKLPEGDKNVLIHDVALDPINNMPIHADFYMVDMQREVEVDVPLEFTGEADAGKASDGILVKVMYEIKIRSLPGNLPHSLLIDISRLQNPKDAVFVKDLVVPNGVVVIADANDTIAILEERKAEAEEAPAVSAEDALKDIEVIKPEKEEEKSEDNMSSEEK
ncbi:MAG TPA: 50S ribosomal protein L25 [Candidatus Paceibacterota bacterium]